MERRLARGLNVQRTSRGELRAMEPGDLESGLDPCQLKGAAYLSLDIETAPPAYIAAKREPAQLSKRHSAPLHVELQRHLAQQRCPVQRAIDAQHPGVGQIAVSYTHLDVYKRQHGNRF